MARKIVWSPSALADVDAIATYIARDSTAYAKAVVCRFIESIERLPRFPRLGRVVPELADPEIRELIVQHYRIIYKFDDNSVTIGAVIHGARLLDPAMEGRTL